MQEDLREAHTAETASEAGTSDRIERSVVIDAPRSRVWRALTEPDEFGRWFGVNLTGQTFAPGQRTRGPITHEGYTHIMFDVLVDRMEPQRSISWRWHPHPADPKVDYDAEEPTRVTFSLEDAPGGGTLLRVVESGFDKLPPHRRMEAFRMNSGGWDFQMERIRAHAATA